MRAGPGARQRSGAAGALRGGGAAMGLRGPRPGPPPGAVPAAPPGTGAPGPGGSEGARGARPGARPRSERREREEGSGGRGAERERGGGGSVGPATEAAWAPSRPCPGAHLPRPRRGASRALGRSGLASCLHIKGVTEEPCTEPRRASLPRGVPPAQGRPQHGPRGDIPARGHPTLAESGGTSSSVSGLLLAVSP